jgi:hypothetical protein
MFMKKLLPLCAVTLAFSASVCFADARHFTYIYETISPEAGEFETENWVTWATRSSNRSRTHELDFRHEIEWGVNDKLRASLYLADWNFVDEPAQDRHGFTYSDSALELIYNLSNPVADAIGSSIYGEIRAGDRLMELESKIILQKKFGALVCAYNETFEAAWAGSDLEERTGELQQALGISYELSPRFSVGTELLHEIIFPEWSRDTTQNVFFGPNVSLRFARWWTTVTALAQLTNTSTEPDVQVRAIVGFGF